MVRSVPPGLYTVRISLNGQAQTQTATVKPDPRFAWTQADYQAAYDFQHQHFAEYSNVDAALNALDAVKKGLDDARVALQKSGKAAPVYTVGQRGVSQGDAL